MLPKSKWARVIMGSPGRDELIETSEGHSYFFGREFAASYYDWKDGHCTVHGDTRCWQSASFHERYLVSRAE